MWRGGIMRGIRNVAGAIKCVIEMRRSSFSLHSLFFYSQRETDVVAQLTTKTSEWPVITSRAESRIIRSWSSCRCHGRFTHALVAVTCLRFKRGRPRTWNRELACDYGVEVKRLALTEILTRSASSLRTDTAVAEVFFFLPRKTLFHMSTYSRGIHRSHVRVCKNNLHAATRAIILTYADWTQATDDVRNKVPCYKARYELNTRFIPMCSDNYAEWSLILFSAYRVTLRYLWHFYFVFLCVSLSLSRILKSVGLA